MPTAASPGSIARCTSPTIRSTTRSSISRPATSASRAVDRATGASAMLVCWDQWFPGSGASRRAAGAQILFYPTAIGWQFDESAEMDAAQHDAWETIQRAHAIANGVFVAVVNRVGREEAGWHPLLGPVLRGRPFGRVLARASAAEDGDRSSSSATSASIERRAADWPFLRDRRIDAYGDSPEALPRLKRGLAARRRAAPARRAIAGPRSGSPTPRPGSTGRTTPRPGPGRLERAVDGLRRDRARAAPSRAREPAGRSAAAEAAASRAARGGRRRGRSDVRFVVAPTNDAWVRDHGPIFVVRGEGARRRARAPPRLRVRRLGRQVSALAISTTRVPDAVADEARPAALRAPTSCSRAARSTATGAAALLTTESCLLIPNRGAGRTREQIEARLADWLGATQVLWLGDGIAGDDTDGHIDDITRFVAPDTWSSATVEPDATRRESRAARREPRAACAACASRRANRSTSIELPMPRRSRIDGQRCPASHANFYLPTAWHWCRPSAERATSERSRSSASAAGARRRRRPLRRSSVYGLGTLHCLSQQEPPTAWKPCRSLQRRDAARSPFVTFCTISADLSAMGYNSALENHGQADGFEAQRD